jgi:hypothetical protein
VSLSCADGARRREATLASIGSSALQEPEKFAAQDASRRTAFLQRRLSMFRRFTLNCRRFATTSLVPAALALAAPTAALAFHLPAPCDSITGSGTITTDTGTTATWAVVGGCKKGGFQGSFTYSDPESGIQISSTEISGYLWDPAMPLARDICGLAVNQDGDDVFFRVHLVDNGEPGSADTFGLAIDNRETAGDRFTIEASTTLTSGNLNLHKTNRSNSANPLLGLLTETQMCGDLNSP